MAEERIRISKRKKRRMIRKIIPMLVALALIFIILIVCAVMGLWSKLSYSDKRSDTAAYFELTSEDEAAIMMDNAYIPEKAYYANDRYYITKALAEENFCDDFYFDESEGVLLYTDADSTKRSQEKDGDFIKKGDTVYLALDYLAKIVDMEVIIYDGPKHLQIKTEWNDIQVANVRKKTSVRELGGKKSPILTDLEKDDTVEVLETMENWTKVKTDDGYIGYVTNKVLGEAKTISETPVTSANAVEITHTLRDHKICMGWHQVMSQAANSTIDNVISNAKEHGMNVISPTWFSMQDDQGNISNIGDKEYISKAHSNGLEVWALCDNFKPDVSTYNVLSKTTTRQNLAANLITNATALGVDGINIDFESLTPECGPAFAQFIRELSILCRQEGIVLSVDNYVPKEYTSFYNRKVQGKYADYVVIMGYDEHFAGSEESGSVASFNFVQDGIEKTLQDVDATQIINGIPFYTRVWTENTSVTSEAVDMQTAEQFIRNHGMTKEWDDTCAQYYAECTEGGNVYKVWLEDADSIKTKLDLMESNNIAGVACWKLGLETADVWDVIGQYMRE